MKKIIWVLTVGLISAACAPVSNEYSFIINYSVSPANLNGIVEITNQEYQDLGFITNTINFDNTSINPPIQKIANGSVVRWVNLDTNHILDIQEENNKFYFPTIKYNGGFASMRFILSNFQ